MSTSEYFSSSPTKRTSAISSPSSTIKLRPSVLNSPAHVMLPSNVPWSPCDMSWAMQSNSTGVVEFRGQTSNPLLCKRKAEQEEMYIKPKKLITEEKMAEHMQGLHISSDFTSHSTTTLEDCSSESVSMESDSSSSSSTDYPFSIASTQDLEQKLRNAQRITICEQIRKLQNEPVIPQAILSRFERPCTALVLWQPPAKITELITEFQRERKALADDEEQENNNSSAIDFNNSMDLDLDL